MTVIVGFTDGKTVYIGGDSAGVSGWDMMIRNDEKVFVNNGFIMGFTSSFRMGQILRYGFMPPSITGNDLYQYMVTDFIDAVRKCLKEGGYVKTEGGRDDGGTFLVGYQGRLFRIESDFQVGEARTHYDAVGCGDMAALGSMFTSTGKPPRERIETALKAAECFSAGVRGPFTILSI